MLDILDNIIMCKQTGLDRKIHPGPLTPGAKKLRFLGNEGHWARTPYLVKMIQIHTPVHMFMLLVAGSLIYNIIIRMRRKNQRKRAGKTSATRGYYYNPTWPIHLLEVCLL